MIFVMVSGISPNEYISGLNPAIICNAADIDGIPYKNNVSESNFFFGVLELSKFHR